MNYEGLQIKTSDTGRYAFHPHHARRHPLSPAACVVCVVVLAFAGGMTLGWELCRAVKCNAVVIHEEGR